MYDFLYTSDLSSVGRAEDCSRCRISLGHWFESGRSEVFYSKFLLFYFEIMCQKTELC